LRSKLLTHKERFDVLAKKIKKIVKQKQSPKIVGKFIGNEKGFGFVVRENGADVFIPPHLTFGALNGDEVTIKIDEKRDFDENGNFRMSGKIIEINKRLPMVGTFYRQGYVSPVDKKIPFKFLVPPKTISRFGLIDGHKVIFSVEKLIRHDGKMANCLITEVLGHSNDPGIDVLTLVIKAGVPYEFDDNVLNELEKIPNEVVGGEETNRLDLRNELLITIDGDDTKDIDDAVSFEVLPDGGYKLGVHIADVTHYVKEETAIDDSALLRGTSIYLADRVIPMLPHKLSSGVCSLFADVDRLTLSCIMTIDKDGNVTDQIIKKSIIRSKKQWSYNKVQEILDSVENKNDDINWFEYFNNMNKLREVLKAKREKRGALDFEFPEAKIRVDEDGKPISIEAYPRSDATGIIEEFMILCNETIASFFLDKKIPFVYRSHEEPSAEKMAGLRVLTKNIGIGGNPMTIQKLLELVKDTPSASAVSTAILHALPQAHYTPENPSHFGLASDAYCHFTSPIRRYADLQIHRVIKYFLENGENANFSNFAGILPNVSSICSRTERIAEALEREVTDLKKAQFMADKVGFVFNGTISGVTSWGVFVILPNTVEGLVPVANLRRFGFSFNKEKNIFEGNKKGKKAVSDLTQGAAIKIKITRVNEEERRITFEIEGLV